MFFFVCSATLFYLQRSSFLFAAFLFFICSVPFFIFAAVPFFVCSASFLFAAFLFCLQRSFFVCSVSLLFAAFLFCLQRFFFICSVSFLFAALLFCLQRVPCGPPYISLLLSLHKQIKKKSPNLFRCLSESCLMFSQSSANRICYIYLRYISFSL